ncbi:hypothetical protein FRC17_005825 [Serendipita sp. 399]|nr:hypothetical protein FRC17_005825 [Serendipita sp. 399]
MSKPRALHALTSAQERRLVTYVEDKLLDITRSFQKRFLPSSKLQTLPEYIHAMRSLIFDIIMSIPPIMPSGALRTSLLLRITADLFEAIPGYRPFVSSDSDETEEEIMSTSGGSGGSEVGETTKHYPLIDLFELFTDLDSAWMAIISCQVWNKETRTGQDVIVSATGMEVEHEYVMKEEDEESKEGILDFAEDIQLYAPNSTECTRLRSLIVTGMSAIEDWLDEAQAPDIAKSPFERCFDWTLRALGEDSNQVTWVQDGFVACGNRLKDGDDEMEDDTVGCGSKHQKVEE